MINQYIHKLNACLASSFSKKATLGCKMTVLRAFFASSARKSGISGCNLDAESMQPTPNASSTRKSGISGCRERRWIAILISCINIQGSACHSGRRYSKNS